MFRIMHVTPTDYGASANRDELQAVADELNRDAIGDGNRQDRWIVVTEDAVGDLYKSTQ